MRSAFDLSRTWSNSITTTGNSGNWHSGYPKTQAFNNNDANYAHANADGSGQAVVTLSFSPALSCSSTVTFLGGVTSSGTGTLQVNGGTAVALVDAGVNPQATHKTTASFTGNITSITITKTGNTNDGLLVYGFEIDGKRLVDNGTTVPNVPAIASTTRANPSTGFSIVSYAGHNDVGTIGHGLNAEPHFILVKNTSVGEEWAVYHKDIGNGNDLVLNSTVAANVASHWNNTTPTSSVISLGYTGSANESGSNYLALAWSPVEGYSAFGLYTGNGSTNGPFVYTGHRSRFIIIKRTNGNGPWVIVDTERNTYNVMDNHLLANVSAAENGSTIGNICDSLSNGFKLRGSDGWFNGSGATYAYASFASHPFKTSRAR